MATYTATRVLDNGPAPAARVARLVVGVGGMVFRAVVIREKAPVAPSGNRGGWA
jgi:hypothetical protein